MNPEKFGQVFELIRAHLDFSRKPERFEAAAADRRIPAKALFHLAIDHTRDDRMDDTYSPNPYQTILSLRSGPTVLSTSIKLVSDPDPARRELGACILQSAWFPDGSFDAVTNRVFRALKRALTKENDERVLVRLLSALTSLEHPDRTALLLQFERHSADNVRLAAADGLFRTSPGRRALPQSSLAALLRMLMDDYKEVRWSILVDITDYPSKFRPAAMEYRSALEKLVEDPDEHIRDQAKRALKKVRAFKT